MDWIFVLSSITYALEAQEILKNEQIVSSLTRSAAIRKVRGCGYGLRIRRKDRTRAEAILQQRGIRILGVTEATDKE